MKKSTRKPREDTPPRPYNYLLVEDAVQPVPFPLDEIQDGLIVLEHKVRNHNTLRSIGGNLALEDVLVEMVVELLVTIVDAQLLEAVGGEALETEDVEQGDDSIAATTTATSASTVTRTTSRLIHIAHFIPDPSPPAPETDTPATKQVEPEGKAFVSYK